MKKNSILVFVACAAFILLLVTAMNIKGDMESRALLEESVKNQLISITAAANEIINPDLFDTYRSAEDVQNNPEYDRQLAALSVLARNTGADYIYALKRIDGEAYFVFDTDPDDTTFFEPYELDPVLEIAFSGKPAAGIMNVQDEYGTFNTGAQPIYKDGRLLGIICADIKDTLIAHNIQQSRTNTILTVVVLLVFLALAGIAFYTLLHRLKLLYDEVDQMAYYDRLTALPNRRFLMERLEQMTTGNDPKPFGLYFIDLDNFKAVNDFAGHDAGDELLQRVAAYLQQAYRSSTVFRPDPGSLSVTARIGGDEFILIVPDITSSKEAETFATELLEGFRNSDINKFAEHPIGLSIGCAFYPGDSQNAHVLINYADMAMYQAKRDGKSSFCIYTPELGGRTDLPNILNA